MLLFYSSGAHRLFSQNLLQVSSNKLNKELFRCRFLDISETENKLRISVSGFCSMIVHSVYCRETSPGGGVL